MIKTTYLDAGPALPQASMEAAMATGRAMETMGNTIQAVGDQGFRIAQRVREAEEAATMSAYFASIDEEAGKFSNELLTRTDPHQWPTDWKQKVEQFKQQGTGLDLSPVAKQALDLKVQDWSTQRSIRMEALAATRIVSEGRATVLTNLQLAADRNDWEAVDLHKENLKGLGFMPSEIEQVDQKLASQRARQELSEDSQNDFQGTLDRLNDPDFLSQPGNELLTQEDVEFAKKEAYQQQRFTIGAATDEFQDLVALGKIRSAADIDEKFGSTLPPRVLQSFKASLAERMKEGFAAKAADPAYRQQVIGYVETALTSLPLEMDKFPEKQVEIQELIATLPTGPTKTALMKRVQDTVEGKNKEFESYADAAMANMVELYKEKNFGEIYTEKTVTSAIDDGFFASRKKLLTAGYDEEQADIIQGKGVNKETMKKAGYSEEEITKLISKIDKKTFNDSDRVDLYRRFSNHKGESKLTGYQERISQAIQRGETTLKETDFDKLGPAEIKRNQAMTEMRQWMNANPTKLNDYEAVKTKRAEILDRSINQSADELFFAPKAPRVEGIGLPPETSQIDLGPKGASDMISSTPVGSDLKSMVRHFEAGGEKAGFHAKAYNDGKQYSIGYGTKAKPGEVISKAEAESRLDSELSSHRQRVIKEADKLGIDFAPHEIDALTSFDYNTGSIGKLLAGGNRSKEEIAEAMLLYTKADGKHLRGLANRRQAESSLFRNGY